MIKGDTALGTGLILALLIIVVLVVISGLSKSEGKSYVKGNNTIANVTFAMVDLNNNQEAEQSAIRWNNLKSDPKFSEEDIREIIEGGDNSKTDGDDNNDNEEKNKTKRIVALEVFN